MGLLPLKRFTKKLVLRYLFECTDMPSIRIIPQTREIYHVYNRGVDKRDIFMNKVDYIRFLHDLYEFNDIALAPAFERRYKSIKNNVGGSTPYIQIRL